MRAHLQPQPRRTSLQTTNQCPVTSASHNSITPAPRRSPTPVSHHVPAHNSLPCNLFLTCDSTLPKLPPTSYTIKLEPSEEILDTLDNFQNFAVATILSGSPSTAKLAHDLNRHCAVWKWNWTPSRVLVDAFMVPFPNSPKLNESLSVVHELPSCTLVFECWSPSLGAFKRELITKIWIQIDNLLPFFKNRSALSNIIKGFEHYVHTSLTALFEFKLPSTSIVVLAIYGGPDHVPSVIDIIIGGYAYHLKTTIIKVLRPQPSNDKPSHSKPDDQTNNHNEHRHQ